MAGGSLEHSMQTWMTGWRISDGVQNIGGTLNIWPGTATGHCLPKLTVTLVFWGRELRCGGKPVAGRGARHHRLPSGSALRTSVAPQIGEKQSQRFGRRTLKAGGHCLRHWRSIQRGTQRNWSQGWPIQRRRRRTGKLWGRPQWNIKTIRRWWRSLGSWGDNFWLWGGYVTRSRQIQEETNLPWQGFVTGSPVGGVLVGARTGGVDVVEQKGSTTIVAVATAIVGQGSRHFKLSNTWKSAGQTLRGQPSRRSVLWSSLWVRRGDNQGVRAHVSVLFTQIPEEVEEETPPGGEYPPPENPGHADPLPPPPNGASTSGKAVMADPATSQTAKVRDSAKWAAMWEGIPEGQGWCTIEEEKPPEDE